MKKTLDIIRTLLKILCGISLVAMVVTVFMQTVSRNIFSHSFAWVEEFAGICMVWITFLGAALTTSYDSHTRIDVLLRALPKKISIVLAIVGHLLCIVFSIVLVKYAGQLVSTTTKKTMAMHIPYEIYYYPLVIGGALTVIFFLVLIAQEIQKLKGPADKTAGNEGGEAK